jgi:hypothetical protein
MRAGARAKQGLQRAPVPDVHGREQRPFSRQADEEHGVLVLIGHGHRFLVPVGPHADQHQQAECVPPAGAVDVNTVRPPTHSSTSGRSDPRLSGIPLLYQAIRGLDTASQEVTMRLVSTRDMGHSANGLGQRGRTEMNEAGAVAIVTGAHGE